MATRTQSTVVAVFRNLSDAQAAANELETNGFSEEEIYISSSDQTRSSEYGSEYKEGTHEGGIAGWFKRVFGGDEESDRDYYQNAVSSGNVLLSVDTNEDNVDTAADILNRYSPIDIQRGNEAGSTQTMPSSGTKAQKTGKASVDTAGTSKAIPVVQEELRVGKRAVLRGGVRVYSRVIETPVEETVNLQEEKVRVDRQKVNRPVSSSDVATGRDEVIEVKEYAEEPVVSKEARVVEEVRVSKEATQKTQKVKDTVRRTEVNVENLGDQGATNVSGQSNFDDDFRSDFTRRYGSTGVSYDTYAPAYRYGYDMASDPRYKGRSFNAVEQDLRSDYGRRYPNSTWEKMKDSIRYGWDKVTGKSSSATTSR